MVSPYCSISFLIAVSPYWYLLVAVSLYWLSLLRYLLIGLVGICLLTHPIRSIQTSFLIGPNRSIQIRKYLMYWVGQCRIYWVGQSLQTYWLYWVGQSLLTYWMYWVGQSFLTYIRKISHTFALALARTHARLRTRTRTNTQLQPGMVESWLRVLRRCPLTPPLPPVRPPTRARTHTHFSKPDEGPQYGGPT